MNTQTTQQTEIEYDPATIEPACHMEPVDWLVTFISCIGAIIGMIAANSGCAG